ncbi:hypothetical protein [Geoalkalibacter halelectricus]|uniref:Lipoprotein n=1 Tax=Geoalkalibacter halelectricus TaxID=2847045 RepID=A0ABY5ZPN1_9BACT|nr:hypothetical protein [Geoalkalibacter halelectricus]MDO3377591.1 hypothetical protein [Geoalkalibacter halelectricus]UWZ80651.1 hypothetical protein L9S41_04440 [Geoalkalibacter halelectricus]
MTGAKRRWIFGLLGLALLALTGCADDDPYEARRLALVGVLDSPHDLQGASQLTLSYFDPWSQRIHSARIYSDQPSGGDIAFDPVANTYLLSQGPSVLLFGVDAADPHRPEFRAFLDFPLDGATGGPVIPLDAEILAATLKLSVEFVDFASRAPVLLDLVHYSVTRGLRPEDFSSPPLAVSAFEILDFDAGGEVLIDVTPLMAAAQRLGLVDFQVRFALGR